MAGTKKQKSYIEKILKWKYRMIPGYIAEEELSDSESESEHENPQEPEELVLKVARHILTIPTEINQETVDEVTNSLLLPESDQLAITTNSTIVINNISYALCDERIPQVTAADCGKIFKVNSEGKIVLE